MRPWSGSEFKAIISLGIIGMALAIGGALVYVIAQNNKIERMSTSVMGARATLSIMQNIQSTEGMSSPH
jgi:hypothetical protein